jgi:tetratricopeptide (TPR) repeat protein
LRRDFAITSRRSFVIKRRQVLRYQEEQAGALEAQGRLLREQAQFSQARGALEASLKLLTSLANAQPDIDAYRQRAAGVRAHLARISAAEEEPTEADRLFEAALTELNGVLQSSPESSTALRDLAWVHQHWGSLLWERGARERASKELSLAVQQWSELVNKWPVAEHQLGYANLMANCVNPELRNAELARRLASEVLEKAPDNAAARSIIAVALFRSLRLKEALETLSRAPGTSSPLARDCFVLAMTQQALGKPREAQRAFDEGLARQQQRPGDEESGRLASEAAGLLHVHPPAASSSPR